jgi:hypothetical protein
VRLAALEVVDDSSARDGGYSVGRLVEREDQWNVWPPSMTIVCPVTKSEPGPQR